MKPVLLLGALLALPGCNAFLSEGTADLAGLAGAAISTAVTDNGAVAAGIGLGVQSVARAGLQYTQRTLQRAEQDSIASAAGPLSVGQVASWSIAHTVPITDDHQGQVTVSRDIGGLGLSCREIVFSVETVMRPQPGAAAAAPPKAPDRGFYTAVICRNGAQWKWASAEPATERWGALQ
ncbi:hypothetical protein E0493_07375 [Roseomonas sp. M0104]|uniref:Lipoprotein n=1 Tax=Teichococcus coralli TaxID=2545983 RepID=A0A845BAQ8_9PROT|nr:hypothetical protein [Pseudoroseomonas coralli]MXP63174.1 hypothetical protein [Pseudoroseomonas coralli]